MIKTKIIGFIILLTGILPLEVSAAGKVNSFIYHRFDDSRYPSTNISADIFQAQLQYLQKQDYQVISHGEIARRLAAGKPLPAKGAALCVDDAFTSFSEVAMPILRKFGFPITLFVNTDAVGSPGYLDWDQLQALQEEGVEIGNHSSSHDYLVEVKGNENFSQWRDRIRKDILKAQAEFERNLGVQPTIFAYPYGEYVPELIDIVKELGFQAAFAQQSGVIYAAQDRFVLPRFPMGGDYATLEGFKSKLAMLPLIVSAEEPVSPLVGSDNPPQLLVQITDQYADTRKINCFVQGSNSCKAEPVQGRDDWYRVTADAPLVGRRNKYTLTAQGKSGGWHWYSHLWLKADLAVEMEKLSVIGELTTQAQAGAGETVEPVVTNQ